MKIGIISGEYPPMRGGVGACAHILAHRYAQQGHEVAILTAPDGLDETLSTTHTRWTPNRMLAIQRWIKQERIEIVHLHYQTAAFQMSPWIHFLPEVIRPLVPLVTTFHDLRFPYLFPKAHFLRTWIVNRLARQSNWAVVTNHEDANRLDWLITHSLIPIGSNILTASPLTQRERQPSTPFQLVYFGFLNDSKGVDTLYHALAHLNQDGIPAQLTMVGDPFGSSDPSNRAYAQQLDRLAQQLSIQPQLTWTGYIPEEAVGQHLAQADAVVLPYRDGASLRRGTLMAAIHYGCAIVTTTPRVSIPEFVHEDNMLLTSSDSPDELANTLGRLYHDKALRMHLQERVYTLREQFNWDKIAQDYLNLFALLITTTSMSAMSSTNIQ